MKRTGRINPVSRKKRKKDASYPAARIAVYERADGMCEAPEDEADGLLCGSEMAEIHHLAGRGGPDPHRLENLAGLCHFHHTHAHANPAWAHSVGLMVSRHGKDAA